MVLVLLNMCCIYFLSLDTNAEKFFFKAPLENSDGLHFKTEHHVPVHQQVEKDTNESFDKLFVFTRPSL